jgi:hypothetical protein
MDRSEQAVAGLNWGHAPLRGRSRREHRAAGTDDTARPTALDLRGSRLAFGWSFQGELDAPGSEIRVDDLRTDRQIRVDTIPGGGLTTIALTAPTLTSSGLYWARLCVGDSGGCPGRAGLRRRRFATGAVARAGIGASVLWQARGAGVTYLLRDRGDFDSCHEPQGGVVGPESCSILGCFDPGSVPEREGPATCSIVATTPAFG